MEIDLKTVKNEKKKRIYPGQVVGWITHYFCLPEDCQNTLTEADTKKLIEAQLRESLKSAINDLAGAKITIDGKGAVFKDEKKDLPKAADGQGHPAE